MKEGKMEGEAEPLIPSEPTLRGMDQVLLLLETEELPDGEIINWKNLDEKVKPYHSMLEFTDNVREAVREYIELKVPKLKEAVSSLGNLDDEDLTIALVDNWFETIEDVDGQRREVLLAVAAHIVKRIEVRAEKELLKEASPEQLKELGIESPMKDLLIDVLDAANKVDPLFVRFLAYAQLSEKPPEGTPPAGGIYLPNDEKPHTIAELFPHETQFLANRFASIASQDGEWKKHPGGPAFARYLESLSEFYTTQSHKRSQEIYKEVIARYQEVVATDFPVILTPTTEGHYNPPYFDPELKVSVSSTETKKEEGAFRRARDLLADNLQEIGAGNFKDTVRGASVKTSIVLGGFGSNLEFPGVAQEEPVYSLFLDKQIEVYDSRIPDFIGLIKTGNKAFDEIPVAARKNYIERMSRMGTMLHEFGHPVNTRASERGKRIGAETVIHVDEVKAESLWRALVPEMIEQGLEGTPEQWADIMTAISLMYISDQPEGDQYYEAGVYNLNQLFEKGIVVLEDKKIVIKDIDAYYVIMKEQARKVLELFEDEKMTEQKAMAWMKENCTPSKALEKCIKYVRKLEY